MKNEPPMTMTRSIILVALFHISVLSVAQEAFVREKRDYVWLLGYNSNFVDTSVGGTRIDFNYSPPLLSYEYRNLDFDATNAAICDTSGNLLFYTNGIAIHAPTIPQGQQITNGGGLNPDPYTQEWASRGYNLPQGALILPDPGNSQFFMLFHSEQTIIPDGGPSNYLRVKKKYYSLIKNNPEEVQDSTLIKNSILIEDTLDFGKITAVRHANGRDWWLLQQEYFSNHYYTLMASPSGVSIVSNQAVGQAIPSGLGQAVFSPDGSKYVHFTTYNFTEGQFVSIYDFDRCSGSLFDLAQINYNDTAFSGGVAISPNSRFLYVSSFRYVYQYDLWAEDIEASKEIVAIYDGFQSPAPLATTFFLCQLAPDGKIYISASNTVKYLHVIHNPNGQGTDCQIEQHGIELPTYNAFGIPNYPYYGLGPEDGSPCDTLGIDHHPQADFRYVVENSEVDFYDYSRFFPTNWHWTFGDGGSSTERDPVHIYAASGVYEVCLIVSNANASDTLCRELEIIITDTQEPLAHKPLLKVFPNPAKDYVVLQVAGSEALPRLQALVKLEWVLYDAFGRELRSIQLQHPEAQTLVNLESLSAGMYFWQLKTNGAVLESGKLSVLR